MTASVRQRVYYIVSDFLLTNIAFMLFNVIRYYMVVEKMHAFSNLQAYMTSGTMVTEQILVPLLFMFIYWLSGYYNSPFHKSQLQELFTTLLTAGINSIFIMLAFLTDDLTTLKSFNYRLLGTAFLLLFLLPYLGRMMLTVYARSKVRSGKIKFPTVIVGASAKATATAAWLDNPKKPTGFDVVGYIPLDGEECAEESKGRLISFKQLHDLVRVNAVNQVIIVTEKHDESKVVELLNSLYTLGLPVKIAPDRMSYLTSGIRLQDIYAEPLVDINAPRMTEAGKNIKRTLDVVVAALALTTLCIPMGILALMVKRSSPGPAIYSQERIGYRRKPFRIYKFRSMYQDAEAKGPSLSSENDSRITPLGRVMRKYRLDELPQFWNVLRGDMSLVGPRPERDFFIRQITAEAPWYPLLLQVRPGITSWGIVKCGYCNDVTQMKERSRYDLVYLSNMSLTVDLKILIYTIQTVVKGRGL